MWTGDCRHGELTITWHCCWSCAFLQHQEMKSKGMLLLNRKGSLPQWGDSYPREQGRDLCFGKASRKEIILLGTSSIYYHCCTAPGGIGSPRRNSCSIPSLNEAKLLSAPRVVLAAGRIASFTTLIFSGYFLPHPWVHTRVSFYAQLSSWLILPGAFPASAPAGDWAAPNNTVKVN